MRVALGGKRAMRAFALLPIVVRCHRRLINGDTLTLTDVSPSNGLQVAEEIATQSLRFAVALGLGYIGWVVASVSRLNCCS